MAEMRRRDEPIEDVLHKTYASHAARLAGLARLLVDDDGLAEELVQEAFVRTWTSWRRVRDHADPLPYVRQAVINLCRSELRRRRTAREHAPLLHVEAGTDDAGDVPGAAAVRDERRSAVVRAISSLSPRQRECVALRYFAECSLAETAAALGISEGAVKTHVHRALASMATMLEEVR